MFAPHDLIESLNQRADAEPAGDQGIGQRQLRVPLEEMAEL
jgi:hypothetical protein